MSDAPEGTESNWVAIERTLNAPVDLVWQMWVDGDHFASWYGPTGARIPVANLDAVVGGRRHVCMEMDTPNGPMQMWFVGEFKELVPGERLVYTEAMGDEDGNATPPEAMGMPPGTPAFTEVVVELTAVDGGTHMKMTHVGVPADSPGGGGWAMAIDKLEALLAGE